MTYQQFISEWNAPTDRILVHTSGSTGKPKPMWVEKRRMVASARLTCDFLGLRQGDTALLCMSLDYIAGKMVAVRALVRGLRLIIVKPSGHPLKGLTEPPTFAAMVPMQVYNSIHDPQEREILRGIKHLIIGGGAIDKSLETELRLMPNAVWSTYGMTETLSHIALRRVNGKDASLWYEPFRSVSVCLNHTDGCLVIDAPEVCGHPLKTNDIAELSADGRKFRIIGRKDNVICSGGIKIHIEEVESALASHMPCPFVITKKRDEKFGEAVVLLLECSPSSAASLLEKARNICTGHLPQYWQPKHYATTPHIPMTETGKPRRAEIEREMGTLENGDIEYGNT